MKLFLLLLTSVLANKDPEELVDLNDLNITIGNYSQNFDLKGQPGLASELAENKTVVIEFIKPNGGSKYDAIVRE